MKYFGVTGLLEKCATQEEMRGDKIGVTPMRWLDIHIASLKCCVAMFAFY